MTLEQLAIFIAVAEREHLTRAADALHLTPSAVSSAIRKLEDLYGVELFDRVGRGISLTQEGRIFLKEARATLARAKSAENLLGELGSLQRGALSICASQTIASYWLPPVLMKFHADYPGIDLSLTISNTAGVARSLLDGITELGFIEGAHEDPHLTVQHITNDALVVVTSPGHPFAQSTKLTLKCLLKKTSWIMREKGSGTRSTFEQALMDNKLDPEDLNIVIDLPSNEAVLSAVLHSQSATAISHAVAAPYLAQGRLVRAPIDLPARAFSILTHKERHLSRAAQTLISMSQAFTT